MVRGLYTAYTGMMQQQARMEVLTNNLANSTTVGFKKEGSTSRAFDQVLAIKVRDSSTSYVDQVIGKMSLGVKVGETYTDYSQGSFKATEGPLDVALSGDGFFNISYRKKGSDEDQVMYTRSGEFALTQDGTLVTKDGEEFLDLYYDTLIRESGYDTAKEKEMLTELYNKWSSGRRQN